MVKNPPANARDIKDVGSIPGSGKSLGEGNGNPLQYSCLENPTDRGAWQATVHRVAESTRPSRWSTHICHYGIIQNYFTAKLPPAPPIHLLVKKKDFLLGHYFF